MASPSASNTTSAGASLCLFVHHPDAERDYAYDRTSPIGKLDLDEAAKRGWTVADMKND